jgi:hypothetical protein
MMESPECERAKRLCEIVANSPQLERDDRIAPVESRAKPVTEESSVTAAAS